MGVERGIPGSSSEGLAVSQRNMCAFLVFVELCEAIVDKIDIVLALSNSNQEVVRLHITVYEASLV